MGGKSGVQFMSGEQLSMMREMRRRCCKNEYQHTFETDSRFPLALSTDLQGR